MVNEFNGQTYLCSATTPCVPIALTDCCGTRIQLTNAVRAHSAGPGYPDVASGNVVCSVAGAIPGCASLRSP